MLAREEWSLPKVQTDVFSLESLIAWLEKQPAGRAYNFSNCEGECLLGQYMADIGEPWSLSNYERLAGRVDPSSRNGRFPIGFAWPHTFGAALARARAVSTRDHSK